MTDNSQALESLAQATAGAGSGVLVALALHPLELVKTRIQTGMSKPPTTKAMAEIFKNEGLMALYGGVGAQCCEEAVENFTFFYFYSVLTGAAKQRLDSISTGLNLALGSIAGVGTMTTILPIEVFSTQMQLAKVDEGPLTILRRMCSGDGFAGLFKGYWVNLILCANPAIVNTCFDKVKDAVVQRRASVGRQPALSALESFFLGACSKALALCLCYPLVRLKVMIQAGNSGTNGHTNGKSSEKEQPLLQRICQMYRGLGTALAKNVVSAALLYALKDQIVQAIKRAVIMAGKRVQQRALAS